MYLSQHYSYGKLLKFTLPTIFVMVFTSIYGVVDGFFLSNFGGKIPFAAVNFVMPVLMILSSLGFMMGTGSSALIGRTLGENEPQRARSQFTSLFGATVLLSAAAACLGLLFLPSVLHLMGCTETMMPYARDYGTIILCFLPFYMIQMYFQAVFVTAGRPKASFLVTVAGGLVNMVLDAVFIGVLGWGAAGAAAATGLGQLTTAVLSVLCFVKKRGTLYFSSFRFCIKDIFQAASNGISELLSNAAASLISVLYNFQLLRFVGEEGVAAYGTLMYVAMIFMAISIGYGMGAGPLISYQYGADNKAELASLTKKSVVIITIGSAVMFALAELLAQPLAHMFAGYDAQLMAVTIQAFRICSPVFLFSGFAVFGSGFFTALNNGPVSALISVIRTMGFQVGFILVFPLLWGQEGIWFSMVAAEFMAMIISGLLLWGFRKRYGYFPVRM